MFDYRIAGGGFLGSVCTERLWKENSANYHNGKPYAKTTRFVNRTGCLHLEAGTRYECSNDEGNSHPCFNLKMQEFKRYRQHFSLAIIN